MKIEDATTRTADSWSMVF